MDFAKEKNIAVLLMAGSGSRFSSEEPKQYFLIKDKPLFYFAANMLNISSVIDYVLYVVPKGYVAKTENLILSSGLNKEHVVIEGGDSREESSFIALQYLKERKTNENSIILIQDADRPFITESLIEENIKRAKKDGAALTMLPSTDSLAIVSDSKVEKYLPRKDVYQLQTPQTFVFSLLFEAFSNANHPLNEYTDDGSILLERGKIKPAIVLGFKNNVKITEKVDLDKMEAHLYE